MHLLLGLQALFGILGAYAASLSMLALHEWSHPDAYQQNGCPKICHNIAWSKELHQGRFEHAEIWPLLMSAWEGLLEQRLTKVTKAGF